MNKSLELKTAIEASKIGARIALKYYNKNIDYQIKKDKSVVTKADLETEQTIKDYINSVFPNSKFLGEEFGGDPNENLFWIIDPIDGTRSYRRGIPTWSVLIALYKNKKIVLGVSYYPILNELLYAQTNKGAFCNEKKVEVSNISELKNTYIGYGSPKYFKDKSVILKLIEAFGTARSPDSHYTTSLVVQGKMDANVDCYAFPWDAASYKILIEEAGGKFTNLQGKEWKFEDRGYIASNGLFHDQLVDIVNQKS